MQEKKPTTRRKTYRERPIVLLTDFGSSDHYVGTMKGVILSINPHATILDLTHDVRAQNIHEAAYLLWASYRYFPEGSIFVAVVDPGVGGGRKIICLEAADRTFIAPDNGLLNLVLTQENVRRSYEIVQTRRFLAQPVSSTFHGRDIFAPVAALLSLGKPVGEFGKPFAIEKPRPVLYDPEGGMAEARILHIDHFGNIVTNVPRKYFEDFALCMGDVRVTLRIRCYAEAPEDQACLIVGSSGLVEVVLKGKSAAKSLGVDAGTPITLFTNRV